MSDEYRIAVVCPSHDTVPASFAFDYGALCAYTAQATPDTWLFGMHNKVGTYVHDARNALMADAIRYQYDAVLWLDSDMRFPQTALVRLLQHRVPVVGINYSKRRMGEGFTALGQIAGDHVETTEQSNGLEQVGALGFGCILIRTECLKGMPDPLAEPWFQNKYLGNGKWMGEDVHFCALLQRVGVPIYVDHDLSKECKHTGLFDFEPVHATIGREEAVAA
jgi:cellulose synthase/poly-beta-1,6-N-acetylglucosamine synthase-like glycosyltransferase